MSSKKLLVAALPVLAGVVIGLAIWGAWGVTNVVISSNSFCLSCHEMATNGEEYSHTIHYANRSGVRADCADCHIPKPFVERVVHMVVASRDVFGHVMGTIDTPEKFEAHRYAMAQRVWAEMSANRSESCRSCHSLDAMDQSKQSAEAIKTMHAPEAADKTCIDCHRGIAHHLPRPPRPAAKAAAVSSPAPATPAPAASAPASASASAPAAAPAPAPASAPAAGTVFVSKPFVPITATASGAAMGQLYVSAPLHVLGTEGAQSHVAATLWMKGGADSSGPLFDAPDGIEVGRLENAPPANAKPGESRNGYTAVALDTFIASDMLVPDLAPVWADVEQNYEFTCAACHELHAPADLKPEAWPAEMSTMAKSANLSPEDAMLTLKWLQTQSRDHAAP